MPVTAIGKIHKPPLRRMASLRVFTSTLEKAGIVASLQADDDPKKGFHITVTFEDKTVMQTAKELLAGFTVSFDIN